MTDGVPFPAAPLRGAAAAASAISAAPAAGAAEAAGERRGRLRPAPAAGAEGGRAADRWAWEPPLAAVLLVLVGWRTQIAGGLRISDCAALAALPVTWSAVHRSRRFSLLLTIALLAAAAGCVLSLSVGDRFNVSSSIQRDQLLFAIGLPAAVAAFVWGRERLGIEGAVIAFGTGVILSSLHLLRSSPNPWKTGLGAAVSVVVLALAHRFGRGGQLLAAAVLGGIFLFRDSRGSTGMLMLIVALLTWQIISDRLRTKTLTPASLRLRQILLLTGLTAAAVLAVVAASLAGYLGEDVQERTAAQSRGSTNLLFAARPELGASWALLTHRPWGYGAGVQPRYEDVRIAMQGMASLHYSPDNGYVHKYMFGHGFELHSGLVDAWIALSVPGAVLIALVAWLGLLALWDNLGTARLRAWLLFTVLLVLMNAAIGPLPVLPPYLVLAAGTALCLEPSAPPPRRDRP